MSKQPLRIDIVSDVVCPWCIIGYKRLEQALASLGEEVEAEIHWHPFELNRQMPEGGENLRTHLAEKYGTTLEGSIKARANLTQMGAELGFRFDYFDEMRMYNTFKAHQLLHFARLQGKESELKLRLFSAFFGERKAVDETEVLVAEGVSVGLDEAQCREVLTSGRYADAVREEQDRWIQAGVRAVPTFVFNGEQGVSGAYDSEALVELIRSL
ncbi:DsbA family oxidoreductase [Ferrimonas marina]|uniref:Predicted dithiol-disulfide isomerase, DsbA family n=1 Tax=Ferrimonas marina TaxID=299255 RepID=A0A1M5MK22_9GAMM|nr:DsbA family oxidoreductase [Ferrimonas marina]SHG77586.1 Predicted dithiol-disulfide isomerase, DsbA family [Ferrimonas marina]